MSTDVDYTLDDLFSRSIEELSQEPPKPGTTYEVGPGIIGSMGYPTLAKREKVYEINEQLSDLFRDDATAEDFTALRALAKGEETDGKSPVREGVTMGEFDQKASRVNCEIATVVLDFDQDVEMHDVSPDMAAVVKAHFTQLRAVSNGQTTS